MGNWINGLVDAWINGRENVLRGDQGRCRAFVVEIGADWWRLVELFGWEWLTNLHQSAPGGGFGSSNPHRLD